jgi:hypothetical protein
VLKHYHHFFSSLISIFLVPPLTYHPPTYNFPFGLIVPLALSWQYRVLDRSNRVVYTHQLILFKATASVGLLVSFYFQRDFSFSSTTPTPLPLVQVLKRSIIRKPAVEPLGLCSQQQPGKSAVKKKKKRQTID